MSKSSVALVIFAGRSRPADPVARADSETSVADLRAAVCLEAGVSPDDISPLGYDYSADGYASVRASWVRHIRQWGYTLHGCQVDEAFALWQEARPDLAAGDDWRAVGVAAHRDEYPAGGCFYGGQCVICCPVPDEDS